MKFKVGDRVERPVNVYKSGSPLRYGTVTRCYTDGQHPELFDVKWDGVSVGKTYLPHGISIAT